MQGRVITISRQCGSGGHTIGSELAKRLDIPFYDKEIIELTAKESGFHEQFVEEKGTFSFSNIDKFSMAGLVTRMMTAHIIKI